MPESNTASEVGRRRPAMTAPKMVGVTHDPHGRAAGMQMEARRRRSKKKPLQNNCVNLRWRARGVIAPSMVAVGARVRGTEDTAVRELRTGTVVGYRHSTRSFVPIRVVALL